MAKKVYLKGEEFVFTKVKGSSETDYREGDVNINPTNIGLGSVNNTSDKDKPVSTAQQKAIDVAYANSNKYTDQKIANLINGAPETMDTLKEISDAISKSKSTEEALNKAIGTKANQTELDTHTGNDTIHITASEREKWNKNGGVIGVRGSAESDYKTGQVTISKEDIGLGNVDNTTDANKSVKYATSAGSASTSAKVSNKLTIASPINSYNDLYFRDEIVTEAIQYDGSSAMTVNLMNVRSDSYQNTVKFTSNDSTTGDSTAPALLTSGETHASIFSKVSTIFKNVRWLLSKMGTTDISTLGDGTVTGALSTLNSNIIAIKPTRIGNQAVTIEPLSSASFDYGISTSYQFCEIMFFGYGSYRQSVKIPLVEGTIKYMTSDTELGGSFNTTFNTGTLTITNKSNKQKLFITHVLMFR